MTTTFKDIIHLYKINFLPETTKPNEVSTFGNLSEKRPLPDNK